MPLIVFIIEKYNRDNKSLRKNYTSAFVCLTLAKSVKIPLVTVTSATALSKAELNADS